MFAQPSPGGRAATPIFPPAIVAGAKSLLMGSFGFDHRLTLLFLHPFILVRSFALRFV